MEQFNFHTHTFYSDGRNAVSDYIQQALQKGMRALGVSDHAPVPMNCNWAMPAASLTDYRREMQSLQAQYQDQIELYCGLEIDYIPGKISPSDQRFRELDLDYCIGSVHFVDQFADGAPWCVDDSVDVFRKGLKQIFQDDIRQAVARYYQLIREMVVQAPPTIVAHLDRIKKHNREQFFFDETEPWYRVEVTRTLECIAQNGLILEVNTKALYRHEMSDPYPSRRVLAEACEMGIPVHLASDAHEAKEITSSFAAATQMLWDAGYREMKLLVDGSWQAVPIDWT